MSTTSRHGASLLVGALFTALPAHAVSMQFILSDHPDGDQNPPPYGLRMDNLFSSASGVTTFSFDHHADTILTVDDSGGPLTINIHGTVYGGVASGANSGYGLGSFTLDFTFSLNVSPSGTGWIVGPGSTGVNGGTLTALAGNADITAGTIFNLYENTSPAQTFLFLQDDHRLSGHPQAGQNYWVGRGWNTTNSNGSPTGDTMDFLFLGQFVPPPPVPLPTTAGLASAALLALGARRRR
ncbi:MAG: hypothetical protein AB7G17_13390 [Phycisphaerales bacterium]